MVSVAAPRASMTVTAMACCTMIATLSMAAATVTATTVVTATLSMAATTAAATVAASAVTTSGATATVTTTASAATATTAAATIFGIHAGETTDVIGHQDSRCRQDSANCQSQQTFFELHVATSVWSCVVISVSNAMSSEFPAAHWSGQPTGTVINLQY
jgi:hypothetical protein